MPPSILTTLVGSYPVPDWLTLCPSEGALVDATRVVFSIQERAGIDVVTDGELYRFDVNHPDTNGMIEYFVSGLTNVRREIRREDRAAFQQIPGLSFRSRPAAVIDGEIGEGTLDLARDYERASRLTSRPVRFTITGPHMLAKTLLDRHYGSVAAVAFALARVLAVQAAEIGAAVLQIDEANITGHPDEWKWASEAVNIVLDAAVSRTAVHLCFGNYGGQTIQSGSWKRLVAYLSALHADHVLLELSRRDGWERDVLKDAAPHVRFGIGVIDIKSNVVETPDEIARRIQDAAEVLGLERIAFVNPDCGFWMLKRSVVDRKIEALVQGRDLFEGSR